MSSASARFVLLVTLAISLLVAPMQQAAAFEALTLRQGDHLHDLVRDAEVAAHLVMSSGSTPRLLVAFPAGNSATAVWFKDTPQPLRWSLRSPSQPLRMADSAGRPLYGMRAEVGVNTASLSIDTALLSSTRLVREFQMTRFSQKVMPPIPDQVFPTPRADAKALTWQRDRLDGKPGYFLSIELVNGTVQNGAFVSTKGDPLSLIITAASGETPLTPLAPISTGAATPTNGTTQSGSDLHRMLRHLTFKEKLLAGSWRFNTYFGRDTILSLALLMPALEPAAIDAALQSVFARVAPSGEVAHEESIGEFALIERLRRHQPLSDTPLLSYTMADTDLMLGPVVASWLLDDPRAAAQAARFLAHPAGAGAGAGAEAGGTTSTGAVLVRNLRWVMRQATPLVEAGHTRHASAFLLGPKHVDVPLSQWRDSNLGLGNDGRFAYDVNAVLMPAALGAVSRFFQSGLLTPYLSAQDHHAFAEAQAFAEHWKRTVPPLFAVALPIEDACKAVQQYAATVNIPANDALASLADLRQPLNFHALALDAQGRALPVMHSDEGARLFFDDPEPAVVARIVSAIMRPFPAGLITPVGMVVANPAFAPAREWPFFDRGKYHGTVVWPWQGALLSAGLGRQMARPDLPASLRETLREARNRLIDAANGVDADTRALELWSWRFADGHFQSEPYLEFEEANALQLWSTMWLSPTVSLR